MRYSAEERQLLGATLRKIRLAHGMKVRQVAAQAGMHHSIVSRAERGSQSPPERLLRTYEELFDVHFDGGQLVERFVPQTIEEFVLELAFDGEGQCSLIRTAWVGRTSDHYFFPMLALDDKQPLDSGFVFETVFWSDRRDAGALISLEHQSTSADRARYGYRMVKGEGIAPNNDFEVVWNCRPPADASKMRFMVPPHARVECLVIKTWTERVGTIAAHYEEEAIIDPRRIILAEVVDPERSYLVTRVNGPLSYESWHEIGWNKLADDSSPRTDHE